MTLKHLRKLLARAEKDSARCAAARAALPPGSSRARVTSANAKWMRAAEARGPGFGISFAAGSVLVGGSLICIIERLIQGA